MLSASKPFEAIHQRGGGSGDWGCRGCGGRGRGASSGGGSKAIRAGGTGRWSQVQRYVPERVYRRGNAVACLTNDVAL